MLRILHLIRPLPLAAFDTIPLKGKANRIRNFREWCWSFCWDTMWKVYLFCNYSLFYGQQSQSLPLEGSVAARAQ